MKDEEKLKSRFCRCPSGCFSRRRFLSEGVQSLSMLAICAPVISLLSSGCGQQPLSGGAGPATVIPNASDNIYTLGFSDYPSLQNVGGSAHVVIQATSGNKDLYVTRVSATVADTVSTICTHQGCAIGTYNSSSQEYVCPCHGSIFSADGAVIQGPATVALPSYVSVIISTGIQVTVP